MPFSVDMHGAQLKTERLILRPPARSDLNSLHDAVRDTLDDLLPWLPWAHRDHSRSDSRRYIKSTLLARGRRSAFEFVIEHRDNGEFVGMASLHRVDWARRSAGLGYWVQRGSWGQGYATEAARALISFGFDNMQLYRIEAHVALPNAGSHRVAVKLGFTREGIARGSELIDSVFVDHVQYGLLCSDRAKSPQ